MSYIDMKKFRPKLLLSEFVLFYDVRERDIVPYLSIGQAKKGDNAILTYCYIDEMCGMSYAYVCCGRKYVNGRVELRNPWGSLAGTYREGALESEYEVVSKELKMENGQRLSDIEEEVSKYRGYDPERAVIHEDILFDEYKHPWYTRDLFAALIDEEYGVGEAIWVTEIQRGDDYVLGTLLNEPFHDIFGVHKGDTVMVVPDYNEDGSVYPRISLKERKG